MAQPDSSVLTNISKWPRCVVDNSTNAESPKYCCTPHFQSTMPSKLHTTPTATPLAPNFWTNKIQNCLHVLKCNHKFHSLLSFWATTPLQSFPLSLLFIRHTCSNSNTSTAKLMALALSYTSVPTCGTISPKTSGTLQVILSSFKSKLQTFLFSQYLS